MRSSSVPHDPNARILWAHAGFERPETVRQIPGASDALVDLAFRSEHGTAARSAACAQRRRVSERSWSAPTRSRRTLALRRRAFQLVARVACKLPRRCRAYRFRNGEKLFADAIAAWAVSGRARGDRCRGGLAIADVAWPARAARPRTNGRIAALRRGWHTTPAPPVVGEHFASISPCAPSRCQASSSVRIDAQMPEHATA